MPTNKSGRDLDRIRSGVRVGGKGVPRRKKRVRKRTGAAQDEKKVSVTLQRLGCNNLPGIEQVTLLKNDGTATYFSNPKVLAAPGANTFAIMGKSETKSLTDLLRDDPSAVLSLGSDGVDLLQNLGGAPTGADGDDDDDDDIPELIGDI